MRTSLTEIAYIESHVLGSAAPEDSLLFEAKTILDAQFADNISAQREGYKLINLYGRKQLKAELENIHNKLFTEPKYGQFVRGIRKLFRQG